MWTGRLRAERGETQSQIIGEPDYIILSSDHCPEIDEIIIYEILTQRL